MKRYIRLLGVLLILFSSCSDFLEEKSQDLIIPKSVKDYREFLFGISGMKPRYILTWTS